MHRGGRASRFSPRPYSVTPLLRPCSAATIGTYCYRAGGGPPRTLALTLTLTLPLIRTLIRPLIRTRTLTLALTLALTLTLIRARWAILEALRPGVLRCDARCAGGSAVLRALFSDHNEYCLLMMTLAVRCMRCTKGW